MSDRPPPSDAGVRDGRGTGGRRAGPGPAAVGGSEPVGRPAPRDGGAAGPRVPPARDRRDRSVWLPLALVALVALPVVVALVALHSPRWHPIGDLAQTELRVREVGTSETPLVGLAGRIGPPEDPGHHPGPLSFYALTPGYRLLGSTPFALQAATALLNLLAVAVAIGIARRRGGPLLALATAAVLALLVRSLGPRVLTEPWNPYLPVLWWVVVLLAVWSVWCDDDALLPVAVGAACLASQTHVPYSALVVVVLGATALRLAWRAVRARRRVPGVVAPSGPIVALAVGVGVVAWIPPVVDELTGDPGNLTVLVRYFLGSEGEPVGLRSGLSLWLSRLDPLTLLTGSLDGPVPGNRALGAAFVAVWALAAVVAWRRRETALLRLHQVTGLAALAGLASMSRIYGALHYYLVLWAWSTTAVAVLAVAATGARALGIGGVRGAVERRDEGDGTDRHAPSGRIGAEEVGGTAGRPAPAGPSEHLPVSPHGGVPAGHGVARDPMAAGRAVVGPSGRGGPVVPRGRAERVAAGVGAVVLVAAVATASVQAAGATQSSAVYSDALAAVTGPTLEALETGDVPGGGEGPYEVRADDPYVIGVQGYGMFTELRRAGVDARLPERLVSTAGEHTFAPGEELPVIVVATGPSVDAWRDRPEAVEVAWVDPRSAEERARQEELIAGVQERLRALGRPDQADEVEANLLVLAVDGDVPDDVRRDLSEIVDLGAPTAVFIAPPGTP